MDLSIPLQEQHIFIANLFIREGFHGQQSLKRN